MLVRCTTSRSIPYLQLITLAKDRSATYSIDGESRTPRNDSSRLPSFNAGIARSIVRIVGRYSHRCVSGSGRVQTVSYA